MARGSFSAGLIVGMAALIGCLMPASVRADADAAKKDLKDAQTAFDNNDPKTASDDLLLAETELDGVPDDAKNAIAGDIKALRQKIADAAGSEAKVTAKKEMDSKMEAARGALDAPQTFDETDKDIQDYLSKDDIKAALGPDAIAAYQKTLSTYRKVVKIKLAAATLATARDDLDKAEKDWPDKLKSMRNTDAPAEQQDAAERMGRSLDEIDPLVKNLSSDSDDVKSVKARYARLLTAYQTEVYKTKAAETYSRLKDGWEGYVDEYSGWDKETTGPSFDDLVHHQGDTWSKLQAPKTVGLVTRANYMLDIWNKDDVIRVLSQSDDKVKEYYNKVRADRVAAMEKLAGFASVVLDGAEKTQLNQDGRDRLEQLASDDLPYCMAGSDKLKGLQDRAMKMVRAFDAKVGGDAAAHQKLFDDLVAAGVKAWPLMAGKVEAAEEFDANAVMSNPDNFKGKSFRFKNVSNRMGWDYSPGNGYQFAMTIDGTPVAAKFDYTVKNAVKDIEKRTAKELADEGYDFVATVVDVGPVVKISRASGTIQTTGGETVGRVTAQADETVQGVRLNIVALHAGPVTAASDQGMVNADGSLSQPPAP